ncbi:hypothetical protein LOTGIDRAFT_238760 [Lottia gigantea]|uniref:CTCK domain-containing protein n=1 Tax=Lottia gigantea TaxID=225164 RepID=V4A6X3_LOTGI|nr:hypothetical protein LOTGIDRAFT_238760 [Lottia gigantea]ESO99683.1 hypothetical protein LOTGIDRAFT_238760 [Lottia gigantea]
MFKAVFVLALCVIVKAQNGERAETNVQGHNVDQKKILALFETSELSKESRNSQKSFIAPLSKPDCCPSRKELVTNVQLGKEVCDVIFPITKPAYKTVCLCDKCAKHCNTKPWYGCRVAKWSLVKLYVCCDVSQICKIVKIGVPTGNCDCMAQFFPVPDPIGVPVKGK